MATNPSNATNPGLSIKGASAPDAGFPDASAVTSATDRREALQALLAFSTLHEQIRRRRAEEALRYAAGLAPSNDPWEFEQFLLDEVLQLVAERALSITGADGIAIALAEGDEIICRASSGSMAPDRGVRLDSKAGFSGTCFRTGHIVRCDDSENDPRVNVAACRRLGTRSMVAVPLLGQESVLGLLEAFSTEPFGFDDGDVRSLNLLAELILAALKPEDEDRIVRAAKVAAAEMRSAELDSLRPMIPPPPAPSVAKPDDRHAALEFSQENIAPDLYQSDSSASFARITCVLAAVAIMILIGGGVWWWRLQGISNVGAASKNSSSSVAVRGEMATSAMGNSSASPVVDAPPIALPPIPNALKGAGPVLVTAIHPSTSEGVSTVVIDLQSPVQYRKNRLPSPERIYFDLLNSALAPGLNGQVIEVKDGLIGRIRVAQTSENVARVVLEIKSGATFWDDLDESHHRLVIEVRDHEATPPSQPNVEPTAPPVPNESKSTPAPTATAPTETSAAPNKFRVVIDAGHGGWDLGTVGRGGLVEKTLVLEVGQRLGSLLESKLGAEVTFTRGDDNYVPLEQRAEIANKSKADLFISVHANYSTLDTARGVETYYSSFFSPPEAREIEFRENATAQSVDHAKLSGAQLKSKVDQSRRLAASVQSALYGMLASQNKGIRNRGVKEASFVVLSGTEMPSILAEISFVSSPADEERLQSAEYREQIAEALFKGIEHYASNTKGVKIASASGRPSGR